MYGATFACGPSYAAVAEDRSLSLALWSTHRCRERFERSDGVGGSVSEETWHEARLIPTSGISGPDEQERRATSAVLAVMTSVREFGRALTRPLGAPAGAVQTFIEVPFMQGETRFYPDGLIRVTRGKVVWTALVEVKTGTNALAGGATGKLPGHRAR